MDYTRKRRNVTYYSDACKMYLRHDFNHKCAYCGAIEEAIAVLPEVADKYFEKDHFSPQRDKGPDVHAYSNLYYACTSCNNKKDAITLPLDPCIHDIFSGEHPHIQGGTAETEYILEHKTPKGDEYITALELNSRYHIEIRENQCAWLLAKEESERILLDLQKKQVLEFSDLQIIVTSLRLSLDSDLYKRICGGNKYAIEFGEACRYLEVKGYKPEIVFEENEIDIKVIVGADTYWGSVQIADSIKECRIKTNILQERRKKSEAYGIFVFIPKTNTMCFYKVDFEQVDWRKKEYRTSTYIAL